MPGIVRAYLCSRYDVIERSIVPAEIGSFDECFITNSLMGIMAVRQFGEYAFPVSEETQTAAIFQSYLQDRLRPFPESL